MPRRGENIRKRKDGRWEGRYIHYYDQNGRAKYASVYGKSYCEVKKKLFEQKGREKRNVPASPGRDMYFNDALEEWLHVVQLRVKESTFAKYTYIAENHLIQKIGREKISQINAARINQFLLEKSREGRLDGTGGLSVSYLQTICFVMKAAMKYAADQNYCAPLSGEIVLPAQKRREPAVLTDYELYRLLSYLQEYPDVRGTGIMLSLFLGLRLGEVCGLRWEDISFEKNVLHVRNTVERIQNVNPKEGEGRTKLIFGAVKTETSNRVLPLPGLLREVLMERREESKASFIIPGAAHEYTDPRAIQYYFQRVLRYCQLKSVNFHMLRHTFATRCMEAGADVKTLSEMLGHANTSVTLGIYVHSSMEQKRKYVNQLETIWGQNYGQLHKDSSQ